MIKIERVISKTVLLTTLCLSLGVGANTSADLTTNQATSFNYMPNMSGMNNGAMNNWLPYNPTANMMQMMGGSNTAYTPYNGMMPYGSYNGMMPYMPNNNWMAGSANNNWGSFGAYNNIMPMMGVNGAMPYTGYNNMMPSNTGVNQVNMNTDFDTLTKTFKEALNVTPSASVPINAWGSLDANAAWGLGDDLNSWTQQAQTSNLSSKDPSDVIAELMTGENAAVYQKIISDAYEKGFADAMTQSGANGICTPTSTELPEFNLEAE